MDNQLFTDLVPSEEASVSGGNFEAFSQAAALAGGDSGYTNTYTYAEVGPNFARSESGSFASSEIPQPVEEPVEA